jgi:hypothetical protein
MLFTRLVSFSFFASEGQNMSAIFGEKVTFPQANGPDVELIVSGTELYASYQTLDGFPVVYDDAKGMFCYARLVDGSLESTGAALGSAPPPGVERAVEDSDEARIRKMNTRAAEFARRARGTAQEK